MTDQQPHTPTTARIKDAYRRSRVWGSGNGSDTYEKEFDRWHAAEIAAAYQRGRIAGLREAARLAEGQDGFNPEQGVANYIAAEIDYIADQMEGDGVV